MKVFLIILAVLFVLICLILSISAEFTVIFDNGWSTKIKVLFIEKDIELSKLLSFLIAPEKTGEQAAEKAKEKKKSKEETVKSDEEVTETYGGQDNVLPDKKDVQDAEVSGEEQTAEKEIVIEEIEITELKASDKNSDGKSEKPTKKNPVQKIIDEDGIVGVMLLASNLVQTLNTAATTLIKGLHIYSLYVKMIIGGGDAATIAEKFGSICSWYYPLKGVIMNQMKVDNFDEYIAPDFIAPRSEYEFQFIGSLSVGLLVKVGLRAGKTFLVNFLKNK